VAWRMRRRTAAWRTPAAVGVVLVAALSIQPFASAARADEPYAANSAAVAGDQALISGDAFGQVSGVIGINEVAGSGNAQANAVAIGGNGPVISITQRASAAGEGKGSAAIRGRAFAGAAGVIGINQSSGVGNAQVNVVVVHWGIPGSVLSDAALAGALPQQSTSPADQHASNGQQGVSVEKTAFAGARGIIQLSQVAGTGNSTTNDVGLQLDMRVNSVP